MPDPTDLPIQQLVPEVLDALRDQNTLLVTAPPGAGKSTVLPLALLDAPWLAGQKILMLEPRRLAARAVASRMAQTLGQNVGERVGYSVRFERRVGKNTQLEVLTEGLLTRRLQQDPSLTGVGVVIFDEFHERSLQADLALALCRQVQAVLREDVRVVVMSATLDEALLAETLQAPILHAQGRTFPLSIQQLAQEPTTHLSVTVARAVRRALQENSVGDILAFLPGVSEIERCKTMLQTDDCGATVMALYGEMPLEAQNAALKALPNTRKVVLATSLAETSLTVEGVRVVVDSGFARVPRFDVRTGLTRLVTTRVSADSATQRAGRAGRLGPGVAHQLWTPATHRTLLPNRRPEILEADLAPLVLELATWGESDLPWVTPPPKAALAQATALLQSLGALHPNGRPTELGQAMQVLSTHPRLACMLQKSKTQGLAALACDVAALLEERDPLRFEDVGVDITTRVEALRQYRSGKPSPNTQAFARLERVAAQHRQVLGVQADNTRANPEDIGGLVMLAYPDRVAALRPGDRLRYRLSGGRGVTLTDNDPLVGEPCLAVAHVDAGSNEGKIFLAAPLALATLEPLAHSVDVAQWDAKNAVFQAERQLRFGELVLRSKPLRDVPESVRVAAVLRAVQQDFSMLSWNEQSMQLRARVASLRLWRAGETWPDLSDEALQATPEDWLGPRLQHVRRQNDLDALPLQQAVLDLLSYAQQRQLETLAPEKLSVPSGSQIRLQYHADGSPPILAVRLQEVFGLLQTPTVNAGGQSVLLHLLSPAYRPVQVTQDLPSFWRNAYFEVRKDLRARYPKHAWPDDPLTASAQRGAKRRQG